MNNLDNMVLPTSRKEFLNWLVTGKLQLNPLWSKAGYRYKFLLRTYLVYPKTLAWLDKLYQYPLLATFLSRQTNLPCKLQRPYLSSCMNTEQCLQGLIYHYDFLSSQPESIVKAFYAESPYLLATVLGKNDAQLTIKIQSNDKFSREGELTLSIFDEQNISLASLTFSIIHYHGKSTLFIAGLQGANTEDSRKIIQQATKACFGVFPKRLVVDAALHIAQFFHLEQIVAVSNQTHIYNNWRYRRRHKHVHSDYDEFWLTLDGQPNNQSLFVLPSEITRKSIEDIASKKRSEYRSRYTLLDQLANDIQVNLSSLIESH